MIIIGFISYGHMELPIAYNWLQAGHTVLTNPQGSKQLFTA
jgi:3-hydroxyisobutyrate dehydrogenase-like beta-hydroxyacid dehydrogenase